MSKILIIDDEVAVRGELRDRVEIMGHEVEEASCVDEAMKYLAEIAVDCVLLDLGIPRKFEGPNNIQHGKTLLERIVATPAAPPVLVITANGLNDYQLSTAVFEAGAKGFIAKPFTTNSVEEKIRKALAAHGDGATERSMHGAEFKGGAIVMHEDRIELCGEDVGGTKGDARIRLILPQLSRKTGAGHFIKASRGELASAISGQVSEPSIANAIKEFREKCTLKLGCGVHDVVVTHRGGGYQLADWITFQIGTEERVHTQAEKDQATVLKELKRFKERTRRQISDRAGIPQGRVKMALSKLDDEGKVNLKGSGSTARYSLREGARQTESATAPADLAKKGEQGPASAAR